MIGHQENDNGMAIILVIYFIDMWTQTTKELSLLLIVMLNYHG